jgi:TatA/E family protein of Tat protein translocase
MPTPGPLELVIILVIALLILGPGKLPEVGASLGKSIREFRKASSDVQESVSVKVDTSPLPPAPATPSAPAPVENPTVESAAVATPPTPASAPAAPAAAAADPASSTSAPTTPTDQTTVAS